MKKKRSAAYIAMFIICFALPFPVYLFAAKYLDRNNYENRTLVTMEDVIEASWYDKAAMMERYIDDHVPYKNELTRAKTLFDLDIFKSLNSDSVLLGKDNWLFYKQDKCIEDYQGSIGISQEEMDAMTRSMNKMNEYCVRNDIELVYLVTPNKETVYGEYYMPDYIEIVSEESRTDKLLDVLNSQTDLSIVYPEQELKKYRDMGYQLYFKYDTHWNSQGAFVGTACLLRELGVENERLENMVSVQSGLASGDLASMIAMGEIFCDDICYEIEGYKTGVHTELVEEREEEYLDYAHYMSDADNGRVIMCIGDSFLKAMEPYISKNYSESYFMHIMNYQQGAIEEAMPDVIVVSATERSFPSLSYALEALLEKIEVD